MRREEVEPDRGHPSQETLQSFLDGGVSQERMQPLHDHLSSCAKCSAELEAWRLLSQAFDHLPAVDPGTDFTDRVMSELPEPRRRWISLWFPGSLFVGKEVDQHVGPRLLEDLVDGVVPKRQEKRLLEHLGGCAECSKDLARARQVFGALNQIEHLATSRGFTDRVMAAIDVERRSQPPATDRVAGWLEAAVAKLRPVSIRGWAGRSGAAVTPTACLALVVHTVLSHPTLGVRELADYASWRLGEVWGSLMDTLSFAFVDLTSAGTGTYLAISGQFEWVLLGAIFYGIACVLVLRAIRSITTQPIRIRGQ